MKNSLRVVRKGSKIKIHFPPRAWTVGFYSIIFCLLFQGMLSFSSETDALTIITLIGFAVAFALSFAVLFFRRVVIDTEKQTLVYFSLWYRQIRLCDIKSTQCVEEEFHDSESSGISYYLTLYLCGGKKIKITTQSPTQNEQLRRELQMAANS